MKRLLVMFAVLAALAGCTGGDKPVREGDSAPDFSLKDLSGRETKLSDYRGKVVVVNFWATWCPPCRSEIPSIARMNAAMAGTPFQLLTVSIDEGGKEPVEALFRNMNVRFPTLLDPSGKVGKRYGITGVPETFIVTPKGVVAKKVIGPLEWDDPRVLATLRNLAQ